MPITTSSPIVSLDEARFHEIDHRVTGLAFEIHNDFGRYVDERIYQRELTRRCEESGLRVSPELHLQVTLDDFRKDYFADHLVNEGVLVETKAAETLAPAHKGQLLNYLFLCGLHHGTLLNFRTERVQHEFVSTRLTPDDRRRFSLCQKQWQAVTPRCPELPTLVQRLVLPLMELESTAGWVSLT